MDAGISTIDIKMSSAKFSYKPFTGSDQMGNEVILQNVVVSRGSAISAGQVLLCEVVVAKAKPHAPVEGLNLESILSINNNQSGFVPQNNGGRYGLHI